MPFLGMGGGSGGGGGLQVRTIAPLTTDMLAPGASQNLGTYLGDAWRLYRVTFDKPARLRMYTTEARRDLDAPRPIATPAALGDGLIFEFAASASVLVSDITPMADGFQEPGADCVALITNTGTVPAVITAELLYLRTE